MFPGVSRFSTTLIHIDVKSSVLCYLKPPILGHFLIFCLSLDCDFNFLFSNKHTKLFHFKHKTQILHLKITYMDFQIVSMCEVYIEVGHQKKFNRNSCESWLRLRCTTVHTVQTHFTTHGTHCKDNVSEFAWFAHKKTVF